MASQGAGDRARRVYARSVVGQLANEPAQSLAAEGAPAAADGAYLAVPGSRLVASADGTLAAVIEPRRVVIVELSRAAPVAEVGLEAAPEDTDVAWVGPPSRLLVVTRGEAHSTVHLIDPIAAGGPQPIAQIRIEAAMRLRATVGPYALAVSARSAAVLMAGEAQVTPYQFPARGLPTVAGAAARQFVVAVAGAIEEWDPQQRIPKRRLRLPRAAAITALGGSERLVWVTTQQDPARIDVVALVNTGQPKAHDLPEPIAEVASHPHRELLVCRGAETGRLYVVDLEGRAPIAALEPEGFDRTDAVALYAGRTSGLIALRAHRPIALIGIDGREVAVAPTARPSAPVIPVAEVPPEEAEPAPPPEPAPPSERARWKPAPDLPLAQALASLGARTTQTRCSPGQYQALLEHYRRYVAAVALRAIAQDWDSGRIAFSSQDRPPFEAEVLGIAGRRSGLAAEHVHEASAGLDEAVAALRAAKQSLAGRVSPLEALCAEHGVSKLGELVLLLVAAPTLWGELARLYGVLSNDPARGACDEHLLWQLLGATTSRRELGRELDPDAPLIRRGLVRASDNRPRPFQSLAIDPVVAKVLAGSSVDADNVPGMTAVPATVSLESFLAPPALLDRALTDLAAAPPGLARICVRGRTGSGRRTLLAALAALGHRTLATIDGAMLIREKRIPALRDLLQHALLGGWVPCIDGLDTIPSDDPAMRATVRELLRDHVGPVAMRLPRHVQPPLDPGYVLIDLPDSSISERAQQWRDALAPHRMAVRDPDELAARFNVGPGTIRTIADSVARTAPADPDAAIESSMRQHLETRLGTVATRVTRLATWSQIVLPADIRDSIVELISRVRHRRKVYDTWGFDQVITSARGLTALFQGGPGTGKTLVASAIAQDLGLDLYRIDLSRVMSKWIGETEQNLAKVFDAAEEGQALILFDEADSLFAKRTEVRTSVDRYANLEVNYLLQRLDTFEGVAILTTNFGTAIDNAFKRRLSCRLTFPFPDEEGRERLWAVHLPARMPRAGKIDLASIARRYRMSGGYIRNAALRAAFLAAEEDSPLTQDHLERAVRAEFREGGKLAESGMLE
jgi:ATPase family associated with various cellular activities (AAA)